jgi:hypothetical protein
LPESHRNGILGAYTEYYPASHPGEHRPTAGYYGFIEVCLPRIKEECMSKELSTTAETANTPEQSLTAVDARKLFDIVKAFISVVSLLAGIGFVFVLVGWIIVSSHVREISLYGIADWTERFIVDANIAFLRDCYDFLFAPKSRSPFTHVIIVILSFVACTWLAAFCSSAWIKNRTYNDKLRRYLDRFRRYGYNVLMLAGIIVGNFAIFFSANKEQTTRVYIFVFTFSFISGAFLLLGLMIRKSGNNPKGFKQIALLSFLILFMVLQVPFIYGKFLYRINVYEINSLSPGIANVIKDPQLAEIFADTTYERYLLADYSDICTFLLKTKSRRDRQFYFVPIKKDLIESYLIRLNVYDGKPHLSALRDLLYEPLAVAAASDRSGVKAVSVDNALEAMFGDESFATEPVNGSSGMNAPVYQNGITAEPDFKPHNEGGDHE